MKHTQRRYGANIGLKPQAGGAQPCPILKHTHRGMGQEYGLTPKLFLERPPPKKKKQGKSKVGSKWKHGLNNCGVLVGF